MKTYWFVFLLFFFFTCSFLPAQTGRDGQRTRLEQERRQLQQKLAEVETSLERLDLQELQEQLLPYVPALRPDDYLIKHSLMVLVYDEEAEQARWVGHVISPQIITGQVGRTNDFRPDPQVRAGSAGEEDYFLKYLQPDSTYEYDGYGYDRGHLAPSADFRWSEIALSESYYYSNMSPQHPDFNRGIWANLENEVRAYLYRHPENELIVFTGPVLKDDLPVQQRSPNQLRIPRQYWKVVYDPAEAEMIGFILPNEGSNYPVAKYAVPVDAVEEVSGIDLFPVLPDTEEERLERSLNKAHWLESVALGEAEPLDPVSLPRNHFNTLQARRYMGQQTDVTICGKAVSARTSRSGNVLINLDKRYPNQIFTVFVRKEKLINFPYDPEKAFVDQYMCASGRVINLGGGPAMFVEDANDLKTYHPE